VNVAIVAILVVVGLAGQQVGHVPRIGLNGRLLWVYLPTYTLVASFSWT
jgi:hypothetical protein